MSEPYRITCPSIDQIPAAEEIARLVTRQCHVVLVFPQSAENPIGSSDKVPVLRRLAEQLPEDFSVFDSGGTVESTWITIMQVIGESEVLESADLILGTISRYRSLADELLTKLALKLDTPLEQVSEDWLYRLAPELTKGNLDDVWMYWFHGTGCRFTNAVTKQIVDVRLEDYGNVHSIPDPYFLAVYARTTPEESQMSRLLEREFHDTLRALTVLAKHGYL